MHIDQERLIRGYDAARTALLDARNEAGHWRGQLSTSALSTATAVMACEMILRDRARQSSSSSAAIPDSQLKELIAGGLRWLADHQNSDGGWGDTTRSLSNISTTMLAHAVFRVRDKQDGGARAREFAETISAAAAYIDRIGGVPAVVARYGKDRTFSVPILTHCALAGLVDWNEIPALPFELACLPPRFYSTVRLPVVSYALPALIAIGQVRHHHRRPWFPLNRITRKLAIGPSLRVLEQIQPTNGGFLEAAPLTSFVTMSLAGMGLSEHPVALKGLEFLVASVRPDGSWPIDTDLATWVTTLSVNALGDDLPSDVVTPIRDWLIGQQYRDWHPYTNAPPGGWAWTELPGGVPDADDTPGAMLALMTLEASDFGDHLETSPTSDSLAAAATWLLGLQNRDGGFPTFCRGWGKLPFDRSSADISAHCLRALDRWLQRDEGSLAFRRRVETSIAKGFRYLDRMQRKDGSWLPLWFGNHHGHDDENPLYGTARVLAAYRDCGRWKSPAAQAGRTWLCRNQNEDGGWGGALGIASSTEETALATEILLHDENSQKAAARGVSWLLDSVESESYREATPIGFYFAKLWYFEDLYPLSFMVGALRRAVRCFAPPPVSAPLQRPLNLPQTTNP